MSESEYKVIKEIKGYFEPGREAAQFSNDGKILYLVDHCNDILKIINTETDEIIEERKDIFDRNNLFKILNEKDKIFMYGLYVFKEVGLHYQPMYNTWKKEYYDTNIEIVHFDKKIEKIEVHKEVVEKHGNRIGSIVFRPFTFPDEKEIWISVGSRIFIINSELKKITREIEGICMDDIGMPIANIVFSFEMVKVKGGEKVPKYYMGTKEAKPVKKSK